MENPVKLDEELHTLLDALCREAITAPQHARLEARLREEPESREAYLAYVDLHLGLRRLATAERSAPSDSAGFAALPGTAPSAALVQPASEPLHPAPPSVLGQRTFWLASALCGAAAAIGLALFAPGFGPAGGSVAALGHLSDVRFASAAGAKFFGELSPPLDAPLELARDYVLTGGMVELAFSSGASAIVESPAVFRILTSTSMGLDVGRCSVHAPPGAEGFRVETPLRSVVDRGTRFAVQVRETSETEVQVVEGIADVYPAAPHPKPGAAPAATAISAKPSTDNPADGVRLTSRKAGRFAAEGPHTVGAVGEFSAEAYRRGLPDRVVGYEAALGPDGGAETLVGVTVQRGGTLKSYSAAKLIGVELTSFRSSDEPDRNGHLTSGGPLPHRGDVLADFALNTGVINPGGSKSPLTADPVLEASDGAAATPGFAVRFRTPVVNGPGPDVVFMELQGMTNPPDGDAFHVAPLRVAPGLKAHTVRSFDVTMTSREAKKLSGFHLYQFDQPIRSLAELLTAECRRTPIRLNFRCLAVGIDLSDLGFASGAAVDGLFFQDAADDSNVVDPVFVAGLPVDGVSAP